MEGYIFLPPEGHRATARQLARLSGYQTISYDNKKVCKLKSDAVVVNWGNSYFPRELKPQPIKIYNDPTHLKKGINKLEAFKLFTEHGIPHPEWTTEDNVASEWFHDGFVVYTRTIINGTNGDGITVQIRGPSEKPRTWMSLSTAKLHTKRFTGKLEYRIHVWEDSILHVQQKKKRKDDQFNTDFYVKNTDNGYIFAIQDVQCPQPVLDACIKAIKVADMHFGAVDVGVKESNGEFCIFEINSRPALSGTTLLKYAEKFKELV
jgi:hypothetical protein